MTPIHDTPGELHGRDGTYGTYGTQGAHSSIVIHIEELVLHGFAPGDRYGIAEAVQGELTRLLSARGLPATLAREGAHENIHAGPFTLQPAAKPAATGTQIARSVYGGMSK